MENFNGRKRASLAALQRQRRRSRKRKRRLRIVPLTLLGVIVFIVVLGVLGFLWGSISFFAYHEPSESVLAPLLIYYISLVCACLLVSLLGRGEAKIPAFVIALIASALSVYFSGIENVDWKRLLLKTAVGLGIAGLSLLISVITAQRRDTNLSTTKELHFD